MKKYLLFLLRLEGFICWDCCELPKLHLKLHNATIFKSRFDFYAAKTLLCCVKMLAHLVIYFSISTIRTIYHQLRTSLLFSYRFFFLPSWHHKSKQTIAFCQSSCCSPPSNISMALVSRSLTELLTCLKILRLVSFWPEILMGPLSRGVRYHPNKCQKRGFFLFISRLLHLPLLWSSRLIKVNWLIV